MVHDTGSSSPRPSLVPDPDARLRSLPYRQSYQGWSIRFPREVPPAEAPEMVHARWADNHIAHALHARLQRSARGCIAHSTMVPATLAVQQDLRLALEHPEACLRVYRLRASGLDMVSWTNAQGAYRAVGSLCT